MVQTTKKELASTPEKALANVTSFLQENANIGMEHADHSDFRTPTITLIQPGSTMEDQFGNSLTEKNAGKFYCKFTKTIYTDPKVILFAFDKQMKESYANKEIKKLNYIFVGMMDMPDDQTPFKYFAQSTALSAVKDLLTQARQLKRPLWSLVVQLKTEFTTLEREGKKYKFYKLKLEIVEQINDVERLTTLKDLAEKAKLVLGSSEVEEDIKTVELVDHDLDVTKDTRPMDENVNPETIPF